MPNREKILVVAESIDVEDSSGTKGRVALIKNLHRAGYEVLVYHYTRKKITIPGITTVAIKENRRSLLFLLSRTERVFRHRIMDLHKPLEKIFGFSFTLFNDRNSIIKALRDIGSFNPDLILTLSKGGSFRPHHALLKMPELHHKWMAYIHDPYPMHLYPRPYAWVEPGYHKKYIFIKEMSVKAKFVAFPSKLLMEWMGSYFKNFQQNGMVIPHQLPNNLNKEEIPAYINPEEFNIVHAGNLLHSRNPETLINAFNRFLIKTPAAEEFSRLVFIGAMGKFSSYLQQRQMDNPRIKVIAENRPLDEVNRVQKEASVNVILEAKSEISPFLPGKFPYCIMANRPILLLGPYYSECRRLLGEDYKYWSEIDDEEKMFQLLQQLYERWQKKDLNLERPDLENYLSSEYLIKVMDPVFKNLEK